jgi:hypothetical protein
VLSFISMNGRQGKMLVVIGAAYLLLALGASVRQALAEEKPPYAERTGTMPGNKAAACGFLMPYDTRSDRQIVKGWRADCGMFGPSVARDGPVGPPPPSSAPGPIHPTA